MSLLAPLGLLGLLGIIALIIIYILKPNYQQKMVSSTYVWKLSLKYRKKRVPINRFRNILIFICQVLILTSCALLLAKPVIAAEKVEKKTEKVAVIDASAGMLVSNDGITRFERAVAQVKILVGDTLNDGGVVSVIVANGNPYFLAQRSTVSDLADIYEELDNLVIPRQLQCSYGSADMDKAVSLAEEVTVENPDAEVLLYTATEYIDKGNIEVVNIAEEDEWNAAVLDVTAVLEENFYTFSVDVGCYGRSQEITVYCEVIGANHDYSSPVILYASEVFDNYEEEKTIIFDTDGSESSVDGIYAYDQLYVHIDEADSFDEDNFLYLYGGIKDTIRVQYSSSLPNNFFNGILDSLSVQMQSDWNIEITKVKPENSQTEGFDFYIFEHVMPDKMPNDGIVFLIDLDKAPEGSGLRLGSNVNVSSDTTLASGVPHPITNYVAAEQITVASYGKIVAHDGYEELMYLAGDPILLVKDDEKSKVVVFSLDVHNSNLVMLPYFPILMLNTFNYFLPVTLTQYTYSVGDTVEVNARGSVLNVTGPETEIEFSNFPASFTVINPGSYTLTQETLSGEYVTENFYVRISNYESNITKQVDALPALPVEKKTEIEDQDLLVYFAAALVALLFIEWWLQSHEYF